MRRTGGRAGHSGPARQVNLSQAGFYRCGHPAAGEHELDRPLSLRRTLQQR